MTGRWSSNPGERLLVIAAVAVLVGGSAYDFYAFSSQALTSITTTTAAGTTSTTTVNGISYYVDNVTSLMVAEDPGTFHFENGSVTFLGVEFRTTCTDYASGCPGVSPPSADNIIVEPTGASITLNMTFTDRTSEVITGGFPIGGFHAFSQHTNPQAGVLIVYTDSSPNYKSYLLVSTVNIAATNSSTSGGAGISSNTAVATVTVTTTLTTQAPQATTTYAIPTNCNFTLPTVTLTTTTITVWPTPPASTTTITVTMTSTSYAQTVTVTSCTYIAPTVTSTITTTANP